MRENDPAGHRLWRRAVAVLLAAAALALVAVTADRITAAVATDRIAGELACLAGSHPQVRVQDFPLLPQLAHGELGRVDAHLDRYVAPGLTVTDVTVRADGVGLPEGRPRLLTIGNLDIGFDVDFDRLPARAADRELRYSAGRDGLLAISTTADVAGAQVPVTVMARTGLRNGKLVLTPEKLDVLGISQPLGPLGAWFGRLVPAQDLPTLPVGLSYRSVAVNGTGLRVGIGGSDLRLDESTLPTENPACGR